MSNGWGDEANQLVRGFSGGMLFGIPLLYTMEVWWIGSVTPPPRVLLGLAIAFVPVFVLTWMEGFRADEEPGMLAAFCDSIVSFGIGIVSVAAVLLLIREIDGETPLVDALGKIGFEAIPFCLGVAIAHSVLARSRGGDDADGSGRHRPTRPTLADLGATTIGAVFFSFNIAPTDEIPLLAAAATPLSLVVLIVASIVISYAIVFEAGFGDQEHRQMQEGVLQHPVTETMVAYVLALAAAAGLLGLFGNLDAGDWLGSLERVLLLGFPAAVGGAAGRLAV